MRLARVVLAVALVGTVAGTAAANGRDPYISTIHFKPGDDTKITAGATFGLLRSDDNGATWQWYCEKAVGYGGTYDPDYEYMPSGALFATTFDGLKVMRDTCTFAATSLGMTFVTNVERGPDNALFITASDPMDAKVYKSTDDGMTLDMGVQPDMADAWWQTIKVAPSSAQRVYLSGYRLPKKCNDDSTNPGTTCTSATDCPESAPDAGTCETFKEFLLYRSIDGGTSYEKLGTDDFTPISRNSTIEIVGVDPSDEDIVYARVTVESGTSGESIYKSTNGGTSWTKILSREPTAGGLSFLVRYDGSCVAATRDIGSWKTPYVSGQGCAAESSTPWTELTGAPHIGCLYESAAHEVWACTQNTASVVLDIPGDMFGIMKSSDLATWTGVLRFQDIQAPESCPVGTVQQDRCVDRYNGDQSAWCCLVPQLGITSTAVSCDGYMACYAMMPDDTVPPKKDPDGCCGVTSKPPVLLTLLVAAMLLVRRRRVR